MRAVKLYPGDDVAHLVEVPKSGFDDTEKFYGMIDGPIDFRRLDEDWGMYFDDEFISKQLPLNFMATVLYRGAGYGTGGHAICGPAILVGITEDGSNTDLPQPALRYLARLGFTIIQET